MTGRDLLGTLAGEGLALETVIRQLPIGAILAEAPSGRLILGNREVERIWRHPFLEAAAVGEYAAYRGFHPDGRQYEPHEWPLARSIGAGEVVVDERIEIERGDGTRGTIRVDSTPVRDRDGRVVAGVVLFSDVTEQRRNEEALALLAEAGRVLESSLELPVLLANVSRLCVPALADGCAIDLLEEGGRLARHAVVAADPALQELVEQLSERFPVDLESAHPVAEAIHSGEPVVVPDASDELLREISQSDEHLAVLRAVRPRSGVAMPLRARGRTTGALTLFRLAGRPAFNEPDQRLVAQLAGRCATVIENARLYTERSSTARTLQASLLPAALPEVPRVELAASYLPVAEGADVGGDFYDVFATGPDESWALALGDVCGKGPRAAALTALVRYTIRAVEGDEGSPSGVLERVNRAMCRQAVDVDCCTALFGRLAPSGAGVRLLLSSAGHPLPLVRRADGRVEAVGAHGTLLGVYPEIPLEDRAVELAPGDLLLLYTDGVTEARWNGGLFGEPRLRDLLAGAGAGGPQQALEAIEQRLLERPDALRDDVAMLALRVREA